MRVYVVTFDDERGGAAIEGVYATVNHATDVSAGIPYTTVHWLEVMPPPGLTPGQIFRMLIEDEQTAGRLTDISIEWQIDDYPDEPKHELAPDDWIELAPDDWIEINGERIQYGRAFWTALPDEWPDPDAMWIGPPESRLRGWRRWCRAQQRRFRRRIRAIQRLLHVHQRRTERSDHEPDEDL